MTTPEWLRPVSERYLGADPGAAPRTVRIAEVLCAACALVAAGMVVTWGWMVVRMLGDPPVHIPVLLTALLLALAGAAMLAVFAPSVVLLRRRGRRRLPLVAGLVLGGLALVGLCVAAEPVTELQQTATDRTVRDWRMAAIVTPQLVVTAAVAFGLALLLRTDSASSWLAARRYQVRRVASEPEAGTEQRGGG
jgi:Na+-driven multidrug efflux pump